VIEVNGLRCPICGEIYGGFHSLRLHVKMSHDHLWGRCPICCRSFRNAVMHYKMVEDPMHRRLLLLTVRSGRSEGSIRRISEEYNLLEGYYGKA
jgi:uncharacterized C2H2 Zn-finger protein